MVDIEQLEAQIKAQLPDARVKVLDPNGDGEHLEAIVVSATFAGKTRVQQHQLVYGALQAELNSGALHALALKTCTPEQAASLAL